MLRTVLAALALSSCATAQTQPAGPVTWDSELGQVVHAGDDGPSAVLEYPAPFGDYAGYLYIDESEDKRYWSAPDVSHDDEDDTTLICPFAIIDSHGRTTRNWGRLTITFSGEAFHTDFTLRRGRCFEEPKDVIRGKLVR